MAEQALGSMEYKPTRLEWLIVIVNSMLANIKDTHLTAYCFPGDKEETIKLHIHHDKRVDKERMSKLEAEIKQIILEVANMYDWDSWVNIETVFSAN